MPYLYVILYVWTNIESNNMVVIKIPTMMIIVKKKLQKNSSTIDAPLQWFPASRLEAFGAWCSGQGGVRNSVFA